MRYKINDEFLQTHMKNMENFILDSIPDESELNHQFSKRFLRKMERLLKYERYRLTKHNFFHYAKAVAVVIFLMTTVFLVTVLSVEAYRIRFFEFITTVWQEFTSVTIYSNDNVELDILTPVESSYVPQGYKVYERKINQYENVIIYIDVDGREIYYAQQLATQSEYIFDSENVNTEIMEIGEQLLYCLENKGIIQLYWYDKSHIYSMIGQIEQVELIKMAENIITKQKNLLR